jgi:hypothetical protein
MLPVVTDVLRTTRQDATPLFNLAIKLISSLDFASCVDFAGEDTLISLLNSQLESASHLGIYIIHKAARHPSQAAALASTPGIFETLVKRWIDFSATHLSSRCDHDITELLETDCTVPIVNGNYGPSRIIAESVPRQLRRQGEVGQGGLWDIFISNGVLSYVKEKCYLGQYANDPLHRSDITIAQGRLLRLLPRLASLNFHAVSDTSNPQLFPLPDEQAESVGCGLLQWAALGMIDPSDEIMRRHIIHFCAELVLAMRGSTQRADHVVTLKKLVATLAGTDTRIMDMLRELPKSAKPDEKENVEQWVSRLVD